MDMKRVQSSNGEAVGYDPDTKTLAVEFKPPPKKIAGALYHVHGVPSEVYQGLLGARSFGRFYSEKIKGKYKTTKIREAA
jgi:hypothetical protein